MIQELYQSAMKFAGEKHSAQKVPGTKANYLLHIANVSMEVIMAHKEDPIFDLELALPMAILHDTIEDTDATFEEIKSQFGLEVANGVLALTKSDAFETKQKKMADSLNRISSGANEVGIVKLADRITNLQEPPASWSVEKRKAYQQEAREILDRLGSTNQFLKNRLTSKIENYSSFLNEN
ncbi:MAG: HD domain-containing protein [bacterium]|nr:HD domain-containing protein [bacterium]